MSVILLVDDDKGFLNIFNRILTKEGHEVKTATDGEAALAVLARTQVDIAILDIAMPKMNGITLLSEIKEVSPLIGVIMLTGEGAISSAVEAMQKGASTYLEKSVGIDKLLLTIKKVENEIEEQRREAETAEYRKLLDSRYGESSSNFKEAKREFEKNFLKMELDAHHWNISATAKDIGLARKNLQLKIKDLGIY
ncbi:MAG: response regulator [Clostridiales Family XIII bacterium]|jgi:DNA-binding NtrC family response regulator|nr:response regulator [Clostridiales Family XIII bacterium]